MSKTMAQPPYHYEIKLWVFPSAEQKRLIKHNSDASRFIYNEMKELYQTATSKITYCNCSTTHLNPGRALKKACNWYFQYSRVVE